MAPMRCSVGNSRPPSRTSKCSSPGRSEGRGIDHIALAGDPAVADSYSPLPLPPDTAPHHFLRTSISGQHDAIGATQVCEFLLGQIDTHDEIERREIDRDRT